MNRTKPLFFTVALTLLMGLFGSAQAQVLLNKSSIQSIEVSPGIEGGDKSTMYGASFLGKTTGAFPGSFFISMNYDMTSLAAQIAPPQPALNTLVIRGGTWSLPIYSGPFYAGAIYGHIDNGTIDGIAPVSASKVNMILIIDGGTKVYEGASGTGTFAGTLNRITRDGRPTLNGTLLLDVSSRLN